MLSGGVCLSAKLPYIILLPEVSCAKALTGTLSYTLTVCASGSVLYGWGFNAFYYLHGYAIAFSK